MGPALERLLASPSALRLLRCINTNNDDAFACLFRHGFKHPAQHAVQRPSRLRRPFSTSFLHRRNDTPASPLDQKVQDEKGYEHVDQEESSQQEPAHARRSFLSLLSDILPSRNDGTYLAVLVSLYTGTPLFQTIQKEEDAFHALEFQADVNAPWSDPRTRLVDHPEYAQNMDLWLELLRFRKRLHGQPGIQNVWSGMMRRHIDLPVTGETADALWAIFIEAGFVDPPFLDQVYDHAKHLSRTKQSHRPNLYCDIVGGWLRAAPEHAVFWHQRMHEDAMIPPDAAATVFEHALRSRDAEKAYRKFKIIYTKTCASGLYDRCMPSVIHFCDYPTTLRWHNFFVERRDHPTPAMESNPIIGHLHVYAKDQKDSLGEQQYSSLRTQPPANPQLPILSRESMNTLVGDAHGIRQKKIGDAFCARLFATGGFSINLVVTGLRMLGLETLGSLALREIAARAQGPSDYLNTIRSLEAAGVGLVDSTFSRALKRFAEEDNKDYFSAVVHSDQHPDTYENAKLQRQLYSSFLAQGKLLEAHTTLAILTMSQSHPDQWMWNFLLQTYCKNSDRRHVMQTLQEMRRHGIPVSEFSLQVVFHTSLGPRKRSHSPVATRTQQDDVDFVANVFLTTLRSGQDVNPSRWREILRRYGMTHRLGSVERLCLWLAAWYSPLLRESSTSVLRSPDQVSSRVTDQIPQSHQAHVGELSRPLATIFSEPLLRAIIAWGFIAAVPAINHDRKLNIPCSTPTSERNDPPERWARGIVLIRQLREYGVNISHSKIRKEVTLRLWMLFGTGRSASRRNRLARSVNEHSLHHYVKHIEQVWGGDFFQQQQGWLDDVVTENELYRVLFQGQLRPRHRYHVDSCGKRRNKTAYNLAGTSSQDFSDNSTS